MRKPKIKRPYRLADVKRCFKTVSDPVVARWIEKGFIPHGTVKRGSMIQYSFSISELVHVGVLLQAGAFGLTRSEDKVLVEHASVDSGGDHHYGEIYFLQDGKELVELYEAAHFDLCYVFNARNFPIRQTSLRNKRASWQFLGLLLPTQAALDFPSKGSPLFESFDGRNLLLIMVGRIAEDVRAVLNIDNLWIPQN